LSVYEIDRRTGVANDFSYLDYLDLRQAPSFEAMAAVQTHVPAAIGAQGDPERRWGALVTAGYFDVVKPSFALGRGFAAPRDDTRGEAPAIVLSHALWRDAFGADPAIVGRPISINRRTATVIGVTASGFRGTDLGIVPEFWIPFSMIDEVEARSGPVTVNRRRFWLSVVGRLRPGADLAAARAELDVIAQTLNRAHGREDSRRFDAQRAGQIAPELRKMAVTVFAAASCIMALVLLSACSNVASLLLGRASARRRETAARMALGASRARLVRQLLTESLLLALLGGIGGAIVATYAVALLGSIRTPFGWPLDLTVAPDPRVLIFCAGLSVLTALAFGLAPALRATRTDLAADLKADWRGGGPAKHAFRFRNGLVVAQVAICTVLLLCLGLSVRSLLATRAVDVGMQTRGLLLAGFDPGLDHRTDQESQESRQLLRRVLDHAAAIPGVASATLTTSVPLTMVVSNSRFVPAENAGNPQALRVRTDIYGVGPQFFATMGIPFRDGTDFGAGAAAGRPAIVNQAFVDAAFPGQSAVGRRVLGDGKALDIVGVVGTAKSRSIVEADRPAIYLPLLTEYSANDTVRGLTLVLKTATPAAGYASQARDAIRRADQSLAVFDVRTMESHFNDALILPRLTSALTVVGGAIGLLMAMVGVYGVVSFSVTRRRRELGIRLAIGARPFEVVMMIVKNGAWLAAVGIVLGVIATTVVARFAASLLHGVSPVDPVTFLLAPSLLLLVAIVASAVPARSAGRIDPVEVLRSE
jgi:predicted permease